MVQTAATNQLSESKARPRYTDKTPAPQAPLNAPIGVVWGGLIAAIGVLILIAVSRLRTRK